MITAEARIESHTSVVPKFAECSEEISAAAPDFNQVFAMQVVTLDQP
jgi:hypothetical protein